jgi:hypothetical protein
MTGQTNDACVFKRWKTAADQARAFNQAGSFATPITSRMSGDGGRSAGIMIAPASVHRRHSQSVGPNPVISRFASTQPCQQ